MFLKQDKEGCYTGIQTNHKKECTGNSIFISSLTVLNMHVPCDIFETVALTSLTEQPSSKATGGKISDDESVDTQLMTPICQNQKSPTVTAPVTGGLSQFCKPSHN